MRIGVPAGKQPVELAGIFEIVLDDGPKIDVVEHVLLKPEVVAKNIVNQPAEKGNIRTGAQGRVKRGSTWMTVVPSSLACMTKRKAIG